MNENIFQAKSRNAELVLAALVLGIVLLILAAAFPASWLNRAVLPIPNTSVPGWTSVWFFRAALILNGLLSLSWGLYRRRQPASNPSASVLEEFSPPIPASVYAALGLLVVLGALLRFWKLQGDLWFDEVIDLVYYVRHPLLDILIRVPGHFPQIFFGLVAKLSLLLFGETAVAYRLPAVIFGILGVWAIFGLARRITGAYEAFLATLLLATSYHHIFFSQDARGYSIQVFFTIAATTALLRACASDSRAAWTSYAILSVLNIYTQFFSVFVFAGLTLTYLGRYLYLRRKTGQAPRGLAGFLWSSAFIGSVSFLLYAEMAPGLLYIVGITARTPAYGAQVSGEFVGELVQGLRAGYGLVALAALAVMGLAGLVSLSRRNLFAAALLTLPVVLGVLCVAVLKLGVHPRFFIYALPGGLVILVRGIACFAEAGARALRLHEPARVSRWVTGGVALAAAVVSLLRLVPYYQLPKQNFSGALAFAEQAKQPDEPLVAVGLAAHAYKVYYGPQVPKAETVRDVQELRRRGQRVWLLYTLPAELRDRNPELLKYIQRDFEVVQRFPGTLGNGTLYVCRAGPLPKEGK
jgi:hypothetical protein